MKPRAECEPEGFVVGKWWSGSSRKENTFMHLFSQPGKWVGASFQNRSHISFHLYPLDFVHNRWKKPDFRSHRTFFQSVPFMSLLERQRWAVNITHTDGVLQQGRTGKSKDQTRPTKSGNTASTCGAWTLPLSSVKSELLPSLLHKSLEEILKASHQGWPLLFTSGRVETQTHKLHYLFFINHSSLRFKSSLISEWKIAFLAVQMESSQEGRLRSLHPPASPQTQPLEGVRSPQLPPGNSIHEKAAFNRAVASGRGGNAATCLGFLQYLHCSSTTLLPAFISLQGKRIEKRLKIAGLWHEDWAQQHHLLWRHSREQNRNWDVPKGAFVELFHLMLNL